MTRVQKAFDCFVWIMDTRVPTISRKLSPLEKEKFKSVLQPGDILLTTNNAYPGWQMVEKLVFKSNWTHAASFVGKGIVVDSQTGGCVAPVPIHEFLNAYHVGVWRPHYKTSQDLKAALGYINDHIGNPYDNNYFNLSENGKYTGVKLIYHALRRMPNPILVPLFTVFGKEILVPESFLRSPDISAIGSTQPNFNKNLASHWPVLLGTVPGGLAGASLGPGAAAVGALFGTILATKIGNKLQK